MDETTAEDNVLTLNPVVGVGIGDLRDTALSVLRQGLLQPNVALQHGAALNAELARVMLGVSELEPAPRDGRFTAAEFRDHPLFSRVARGWLAWQQSLLDWVGAVGFEGDDLERARFVATVATDALAPSNFLLTNPSALRKARETRGVSLIRGMKNLLDDVRHNRGMPSQVDKSAFEVGLNLANSEGAVVHRAPILELIQYQPRTDEVVRRPIFIVPPQINKYYLYDMSAEKSMVRYLTDSGFQVFMVSWRNPTAEHRDWGLEAYVEALDTAMDEALAITKADALNVVGACAGGITLAIALGYLAGRDDLDKVASLTLMVNVLEQGSEDSVIGLFASDAAVDAARARSAKAGVLDGNDTARVFNWMRPNDLIWNYVVSNYLHGESPPAFDILYWNNDTTRLPAQLHSDFLDVFRDNPLSKPGAMSIGGVPIDLKAVTVPAFITGGTTDHITPWQACYRSTGLLGGDVTYVLSTAGHIQSLINPPGSSKRTYYTNDEIAPTANAWLQGAEEHPGSWWPYWAEWLRALHAESRPAPTGFGDAEHPELCPAPGTYVLE